MSPSDDTNRLRNFRAMDKQVAEKLGLYDKDIIQENDEFYGVLRTVYTPDNIMPDSQRELVPAFSTVEGVLEKAISEGRAANMDSAMLQKILDNKTLTPAQKCGRIIQLWK